MDLNAVHLAVWILIGFSLITALARPEKHSDVAPKDSYRRQVLPAIPGYIPVYIQHGEEPPAWKSSPYKQKIKQKTRPAIVRNRNEKRPEKISKNPKSSQTVAGPNIKRRPENPINIPRPFYKQL